MRVASGAAPGAAALAQAPAAVIGDLAIIRKLTSVADISRLLHDTLARERAVDQELEQLLGRRVQVEQGLLGLRGSTAEVRGGIPIFFMGCEDEVTAMFTIKDFPAGPLRVGNPQTDMYASY